MIMGKLDRNGDTLIDREEWVSQLNELFRFMNSTAFEKHADELCRLLPLSDHLAAAGQPVSIAQN